MLHRTKILNKLLHDKCLKHEANKAKDFQEN